MNVVAQKPMSPMAMVLKAEEKYYEASALAQKIVSGEEMINPGATLRQAIDTAKTGYELVRTADASPGKLNNAFGPMFLKTLQEDITLLSSAQGKSGAAFLKPIEEAANRMYQTADNHLHEVLANL